MLRLVKRGVVFFLSLMGALTVAAGLWVWSNGISTRPAPGAMETAIARRARSLAIPSAIRTRTNPEASTPDALRSGLEHYADHCASCHANDGSGNTEVGRGLYPKAPDMRLAATQSLTDGELFSIIRNGIRLAGMPAWGSGTPEDDLGTWGLVHFIRHLPRISEEELDEMRQLNPRSPAEIEKEREIERFLAGERSPVGGSGHKH